MKQLSLRNFMKHTLINDSLNHTNLISMPISQFAKNEEEILVSSDTDIAEDEEDKENLKSKYFHLQREVSPSMAIAGLGTKLTTATREHSSLSNSTSTSSSITITILQPSVSNLELPDKKFVATNLGEKEKLLLKEHGFPANVAVFVPSCDVSSRKTIKSLEANEFTMNFNGEPCLKGRHSIGDQISRKRNRSTSQHSSDSESIDHYKHPITEDNQWEVEKILAKRIVMEEGRRITQYYLKWKGWSHKFSSWEGHCNANNMTSLVNRRVFYGPF